MVQSSKSKVHYTEEFKLSVLKDMYENGMSQGATARKYGIKSSSCVCMWEKRYPVDSKLLSLPNKVITKVKAMQKERKLIAMRKAPQTREEQLVHEVEILRKALAYSELRNEALHEVLEIGREQYGIDLLKKAGAKQ